MQKIARWPALLFLLLAASPALAAGDLAAIRRQASRIDDLGPFLERYVGVCRDDTARGDCERNVRVARRGLDGRIFSTVVGEQTLELVRPERTAAGYRYVVTPFIDGGKGVALTNGSPRRQDAAGRPLVGLLVLDGPLPVGLDEAGLESALRTGRVELEVLFRPERAWRLKRKGATGFYEGVGARFLALRLVESRTGLELASTIIAP